MDLLDLSPEESELEVNVQGKEYVFKFGKFNLERVKHLDSYFKGKFSEALDGGKAEDLCYIAYAIMSVESKRELMGIEFIDIDVDGKEKSISLKGPDKLMNILNSVNDLIKLYKCIATSLGVSVNLNVPKKDKDVDTKKKRGRN